MRSLALLLLLILALAPPAASQWAVIDATAAGQRITQLAEQVKSAVNTAQIVLTGYDQLKQQIAQTTHMVTNLQRLPSSIVNDVLRIGQQISGVLTSSQGIGFNLQTSLSNFDALYPTIQGAGNSAQAIALRLQWLTQRQEATRLGVRVQSIASDLTQSFAQLCALLGSSLAVKGNLDAQQVTHQQHALDQQIALQSQQMQAVRDRLATQDAAEQMVLQRIQLEQMQQAHRPLDTTEPYVTHGQLQDYATWDR
jgi:P-type conjugative transfer protein TrbJ